MSIVVRKAFVSSATDILRNRELVARVLIADADTDTRALYREVMRGCHVVEAEDGRDALVKALSYPPALVITETRLPIVDGFALCDVLRRDSQTRSYRFSS